MPNAQYAGGRFRSTKAMVSGMNVPDDSPASACKPSTVPMSGEKGSRNEAAANTGADTSSTRRGPHTAPSHTASGPTSICAQGLRRGDPGALVIPGAHRPAYVRQPEGAQAPRDGGNERAAQHGEDAHPGPGGGDAGAGHATSPPGLARQVQAHRMRAWRVPLGRHRRPRACPPASPRTCPAAAGPPRRPGRPAGCGRGCAAPPW